MAWWFGAVARATLLAAFVAMVGSGWQAQAKPEGSSVPLSKPTVQSPETPKAATATNAPAPPEVASSAVPAASTETADPPAATGHMEQYGGINDIIVMVVGGLLALVIGFVAILILRRPRNVNQSQPSKEPDMGYDNRISTQRSLGREEHLGSVISDLLKRVRLLEQKVTALESGGAERAPNTMLDSPRRSQPNYGADQSENYYDRRRELQNLPEDDWSTTQRAPANGQPPEPPRTVQPGTGSSDQFANDLAELFNRANKPDFDALASQYGAESYTNDRRGDLAQLIKDVNDRFWVVPVPGQPDFALMIPGFTVKKSWAKLRQPESDHPLAHHFELRRGERLHVVKPAVLRRNSKNFWELHQKGEVVGIS